MAAAAVVPIRVKAPNAPNEGAEPIFGSRKVTLCSVFFQETEEYMIKVMAMQPDGQLGGLSFYKMPAAPRTGYVCMDVYTGITIRRVPDPEDNGQWIQAASTIEPEIIAGDLINKWAKSTLKADEMIGPGIGIIAGDVPTERELEGLRLGRQEPWCQAMVNAASDYAMKGEHGQINELHRGCARWLLGDSADGLPWMHKKVYDRVKNCRGCGKQIMAAALRCEHCTMDLVKFYKDYKLDVAADPAVAQFMAEIAAAQNPVRFQPNQPQN